ncbi:hydrolase [Saccharomonospora piscinae]|uniref:NlpC/P60 family protein n=1 Tax=Saccharomonospora piscinae TaxID=687388 RepID=UPI00110735FA|nr:NlpC/P60 family protein [Saccharomonospora piscinae]TLW94953.1 hydrolase [Saccharomonospora piscinae]
MPSERVRTSRPAAVLALLVAALSGACHVASAQPPDNPSDSEIRQSEERAQRRADAVGRLANDLAETEARLGELHAEVAAQREAANKARVDHDSAVAAAEEADRAATAAERRAHGARATLGDARRDFDDFVAGSYRQGGVIGSVGAYLGAENPRDVLAREQLLGAVGEVHLGTLRRLQDALVEAANADADAREALRTAETRRVEARQASEAADAAMADAVSAAREQQRELRAVEADKRDVERRLAQARNTVDGLHAQRDRYERWRDQQAAAAPPAAPAPAAPATPPAASGHSGDVVESVVARALSQLGVPYAWGGGNAHGPTYGIRDGGVADAHGDYNKIGFDCSGLMIYAFASVAALPHYSGYQYEAGRKIPLAQMRRGDMLFWGPGRIHHVALYLGDGQMVEAPYSGGHVRVAPVRYSGIMPYVTRLVE